jgi:hypothetical protein
MSILLAEVRQVTKEGDTFTERTLTCPNATFINGNPDEALRIITAEIERFKEQLETTIIARTDEVWRKEITNAVNLVAASLPTRKAMASEALKLLVTAGVEKSTARQLSSVLAIHMRRFGKIERLLTESHLWEPPTAERPALGSSVDGADNVVAAEPDPDSTVLRETGDGVAAPNLAANKAQGDGEECKIEWIDPDFA